MSYTRQPLIPQYPAYKPSGVDWLGEIPEHWEAVSLGSILELKSDKNHPDFEVLSVYREYGVIQKDSRDDNHNATSLDKTNYKAVNPGDLVVNKMKAWQGSMGISQYKGIVSPAYITCNVKSNKIIADFLHQLLRSQSYIGEYNRISYGVRIGQWDMHYEDFKRVTVLLPPPEEQSAIASFLDRKTAQIDQAIAQKVRMIELLKERRQILIQNAVTKGLDSTVIMKESGVEWIGEIPEHWEVKKLKHLSKIIDCKNRTPEYIENGKYFVVRTSNVKSGKLINENRLLTDFRNFSIWTERGIPKENSILFTREAPAGEACLVPAEIELCLGQRMMSIDGFKNQLSNNFLLYMLYTPVVQIYIELMSSGSTVTHLRVPQVYDMPIVLPPYTEQLTVLKHIETFTPKIDTAISFKEQEIEKLKEYKATLINSAVTGKIKCVDLNSN